MTANADVHAVDTVDGKRAGGGGGGRGGQQQGAGGGIRAPFRCHNCNIPYHTWANCKIYGNVAPGEHKCNNCFGFHVSRCKKTGHVNAVSAKAQQQNSN
jgi:hypothetical protein